MLEDGTIVAASLSASLEKTAARIHSGFARIIWCAKTGNVLNIKSIQHVRLKVCMRNRKMSHLSDYHD